MNSASPYAIEKLTLFTHPLIENENSPVQVCLTERVLNQYILGDSAH